MAALPEISKKWWTSEKPAEIKGQDLEKALANAEKALEAADKKGDEGSIEACLAALKSLGTTADKTVKKECDKKKHKELIAVLEKYEKVIDEEVERLQKVKAALAADAEKEDEESEDDEDSKGKLFQPEYLVKMIKVLKSGSELKFSFGLDKSSPENSCLLLCRKREPERLFKMMRSKTEFSNRLMTYGLAKADGKTLQFSLSDNAKEPSQICKLAKVFLKKNPELKFKKLKVVCGGQTFEEDMEGEGAPAGDLNKELEKIQNLVAAWETALKDVSGQIDALREKLNKENDPALRTVGEGLGNVVSQFPDLDLSKLVAAAKANDRAAYDQTLVQTAKEVHEARDLLANGPLLSTIDSNPFVNTTVHSTVDSVLNRITSELGVSA